MIQSSSAERISPCLCLTFWHRFVEEIFSALCWGLVGGTETLPSVTIWIMSDGGKHKNMEGRKGCALMREGSRTGATRTVLMTSWQKEMRFVCLFANYLVYFLKPSHGVLQLNSEYCYGSDPSCIVYSYNTVVSGSYSPVNTAGLLIRNKTIFN